MIDYYANVDFDQEVWVLDGGRLEQQVLRDVCADHGDDDGKYGVEGTALVEYWPNYQLPHRVLQSFETEAEAEHAYWLLLVHNVTTTDTAPALLWTRVDAREAVEDKIRWAEEDVRDRVRYSGGNTEWANSDGHGEKVAYWTAQLTQLENA
jgi:hypothetical protein